MQYDLIIRSSIVNSSGLWPRRSNWRDHGVSSLLSLTWPWNILHLLSLLSVSLWCLHKQLNCHKQGKTSYIHLAWPIDHTDSLLWLRLSHCLGILNFIKEGFVCQEINFTFLICKGGNWFLSLLQPLNHSNLIINGGQQMQLLKQIN